MISIQRKYERFLRLEDIADPGKLIRARAIYMICLAFCLTQLVNLALMSYSYKAYTFDHTVSLVSCVVMVLVCHLLRYTKRFSLIAAGLSFAILLGIFLASVPDKTGIHTALTPMLVIGAIINGFISGWRAVCLYSVAALAMIWGLYFVSVQTPLFMEVGGAFVYEQRTFQRAVQASLALFMSAIIISMFSRSMHGLFQILEESLEKARNADLAKSVFLANMSHELRTPLNGVIGMNELLLRTELNSQQRQYAEIVGGCSAGLIAIINDVLDLSKMDAKKIELKYEPVNLRELIISLLHLHHPAAVKKGLKLYLQYDQSIPTQFICDESRLRQIINNLIGNAVKFTNAGYVSVVIGGAFAPDGHYQLELKIEDTGIGIAEEDIDSVFHRFAQANNELSSVSAGTGLGLTISSELVRLMGGEIKATSTLGEGTTFHVSIKMKLVDEPPQSVAAA